MNNKALRKELERALIKSIEETLKKRNAIVAKKIQKNVAGASKSVAKKFYKAIKKLSAKTETKTATPKKNISMNKNASGLARKKVAVKKKK